MALEMLYLVHLWYDDQEVGRVMAGTCGTSSFGQGPVAQPYKREGHDEILVSSYRSLARAEIRIQRRLCCESPDKYSEPLSADEFDDDEFRYPVGDAERIFLNDPVGQLDYAYQRVCNAWIVSSHASIVFNVKSVMAKPTVARWLAKSMVTLDDIRGNTHIPTNGGVTKPETLLDHPQ